MFLSGSVSVNITSVTTEWGGSKSMIAAAMGTASSPVALKLYATTWVKPPTAVPCTTTKLFAPPAGTSPCSTRPTPAADVAK